MSGPEGIRTPVRFNAIEGRDECAFMMALLLRFLSKM